jgi:hypothetical protein
MNNKMSIIFLCIVLVTAIILGGIMISGVSDQINEYKRQIYTESANLLPELSGFETNPDS